MRKRHEPSTTLTLATPPQASLRALKKAVAQRAKWRIMVGGTDDQPRFLIEKSVQYEFVRRLSMVGRYYITGSVQTTQSGETTLHYGISGQSGVPFLHAAFHIVFVLVLTFIIGIGVFSPPLGVNGVGILLLSGLVVVMVVYGLLAYRSYRGHLMELQHFMDEFAQQMADG